MELEAELRTATTTTKQQQHSVMLLLINTNSKHSSGVKREYQAQAECWSCKNVTKFLKTGVVKASKTSSSQITMIVWMTVVSSFSFSILYHFISRIGNSIRQFDLAVLLLVFFL
jgi:hypothetical protein